MPQDNAPLPAIPADAATFVVARNPDPSSRLPFLVRLPLQGGLWLKAREEWPRSTRVYCHPCSGEPDLRQLEVVEQVAIVSCERRGPAVDLVLDRGVNRRAQFIFTTVRGRPAIFWQTPKVAALARPGTRVPFRAAQTLERIIVDTRERYGYSFKACNVPIERAPLRYGDYLALDGRSAVAIVERKTGDDFVHSLADGRLAFALAELISIPHAAVVVESAYSRILRAPHVSPVALTRVLARLEVRYPNVPIVFVENRALGERWTLAFFLAAAEEREPSRELPLSRLLRTNNGHHGVHPHEVSDY